MSEALNNSKPSYIPNTDSRFELPRSRSEVVFSPYAVEPRVVKDFDESLDELLDPNNDLSTRSIQDAAVKPPEGRGVVSEDSLAYSKAVLGSTEDDGPKLDGNVLQIIKSYIESGDELSSDKTIDKIRGDKELRIELGEYFLRKLVGMSDKLPDRIARNDQKNSTTLGYNNIPNLRSREYACLLALAQLDGTFNPIKASSEEIQKDSSGKVLVGQHRAAAEMLLFN